MASLSVSASAGIRTALLDATKTAIADKAGYTSALERAHHVFGGTALGPSAVLPHELSITTEELTAQIIGLVGQGRSAEKLADILPFQARIEEQLHILAVRAARSGKSISTTMARMSDEIGYAADEIARLTQLRDRALARLGTQADRGAATLAGLREETYYMQQDVGRLYDFAIGSLSAGRRNGEQMLAEAGLRWDQTQLYIAQADRVEERILSDYALLARSRDSLGRT